MVDYDHFLNTELGHISLDANHSRQDLGCMMLLPITKQVKYWRPLEETCSISLQELPHGIVCVPNNMVAVLDVGSG